MPLTGVQWSEAQTQKWAKPIPYPILMKLEGHTTAKLPLPSLKMFCWCLEVPGSNAKMGKNSKMYSFSDPDETENYIIQPNAT